MLTVLCSALLFVICFCLYNIGFLPLVYGVSIVTVLALCALGVTYIVQTNKEGKWSMPNEVKDTARIVKGFVVAKKEQYCPIIEWED